MRRSAGIFWLLIAFSLSSVSALEVNSGGQKGTVRTLSAKTFGKATLNFGAGFLFQQSSDYLEGPVQNNSYGQIAGPDGTYISNADLEPARLFSSNIFLSVNPLSFLDLAVSFPFYYDWSGIEGVRDGGIGDLQFSSKIKIPVKSSFFHQGYYIKGTIPIGMKKNGIFPRHSHLNENYTKNPTVTYYSPNSATLTGALLLTFDFKTLYQKIPVQIHANLGGSLTSSHKDQSNLILGGLAIEYTPYEFLTLFADLNGESRLSNVSTSLSPTKDPILFSPGVKFTIPAGLYLSLTGDFSLSSKHKNARMNWNPGSGDAKGYEFSTGVVPSYGAQFLIGWSGYMTVQDDDKDGIKNNEDRCPKDAEDIDGFEDSDGCPDPDNDKDGVPDLKDKCPMDTEDKDGFEDSDGCPDVDNDNDGIDDLKDQCPNMAEDFDGFEDRDGCLDPDNDKDGVTDSLDRCPNEIEDFDSYEDEDGCPDSDNDKDGINDLKDKCANEPETINGYLDTDGCPDSVRKEPDIPNQQILHGVQFQNNGPEMTFDSYQYFEPLIKQLKQYPDVEIEVRGHIDSIGEYLKNTQLTQMRAEAVRQYLISKGIRASRIKAVGVGSSSPIADNRTAAGRAQNRRIEIVRTK